MTKDQQLNVLLYGEEKPKRKAAGKPPTVLHETFEAQMQTLSPEESAFVRHVLAGASAFESYGRIRPHTADQTRRNHGARWMQRKAIAHALALGRKAGAMQAITGLKFDLTTAHNEICGHIEEAIRQENMNAVASLMKLKMTLHKLDQPAAQQQQGVQIVLQSADGVQIRSFGSVPAPSNVDAIEGEVIE